MHPARRIVTALVVLPVWIVMILTGGQWCLMPGSATAHPVVSSAPSVGHAAHAAHTAHAAHAGTRADDGHVTGASRVQAEQASHHAPVDHGPRGCESQAACSVAIAPAPAPDIVVAADLGAQPARAPADRLESRALAPELPPPRA